MELTLKLLEFGGSIASIIGLILAIKMKDSLRNKILYSIVALTCIGAGVCFYEYNKVTSRQLQIEKQKEALKKEAKDLLETIPAYISEYDSGENEGILFLTLSFLEKNKDLVPETYELYKNEVIRRLDHMDSSYDVIHHRENLKFAAEASRQFLKSLAEKDE